MLSIILDRFLPSPRLRENIVRLSFFTFQGLLTSIILNDIIRILFGHTDDKQTVELGIASIVTVAPFLSKRLVLFGNKTNNYAMGFGIAVGSMLVSESEKEAHHRWVDEKGKEHKRRRW